MSIQPLSLVVSLPNQLFGHVPITNIAPHFSELLELSENEDDETASTIPELTEIFHVGQYVRVVVVTVHASSSTAASGLNKSRNELARISGRVELTLFPERVNAGVVKSDLKKNFVRCVA